MHWPMCLFKNFLIYSSKLWESKETIEKTFIKAQIHTVCLCFYREITKNKLKQIGGLTFQDLKNLKVLKLRKNSISKIYDGAFYGLDKLVTL